MMTYLTSRVTGEKRAQTSCIERRPQTRHRLLGLMLGCLVFAGSAAQAGLVTQASSRASLAGNDSVAWGTAAQDGATATSPHAVNSVGGIGVTATHAGDFMLFVQNGAAFTGNFNDGEVVLDTNFAGGSIRIDFLSPIRGVGFNIAHANWSDFTGTLAFYGAGNSLFGTVDVGGTSSGDNDGSAPFLGGYSSDLDIVAVVISVDEQLGGTDFAINELSLLTTGNGGGDGGGDDEGKVPEPATAMLVALGLAGGLVRRKRRARQTP